MAHFHFKSFPRPISQSFAQPQFSNILRSVCNLQIKKEVIAPVTATFCKFFDDVRKKEIVVQIQLLLNQISNFPNCSVAHRKMLPMTYRLKTIALYKIVKFLCTQTLWAPCSTEP